MSEPQSLKFLESHEWIESGKEIAAVGISDHAQSELSDVVYVELPEVGRMVSAKDPVAVVESVKAASDIYAPVSGEIVEVNGSLEADPSQVNSDAFGGGWLFKIKVANPAEVEAMLSFDDYMKQIN